MQARGFYPPCQIGLNKSIENLTPDAEEQPLNNPDELKEINITMVLDNLLIAIENEGKEKVFGSPLWGSKKFFWPKKKFFC